MATLVTGGAGYIGSHLLNFMDDEQEMVVWDKTITQKYKVLNRNVSYFEGDICDSNILQTITRRFEIDKIFHLAALKSVEESLKVPNIFDHVNVSGLENLIAGINREVPIIFASSAAVYGDTNSMEPINECTTVAPMSPYAQSKLDAEKILRTWGGKSVSLRLFNVAGKLSGVKFSSNESNVVPIYCKSIRDNIPLKVFGNSFQTPDGTSIRDYVHVQDVVSAMKLASEFISGKGGGESQVWNVCSGVGTSMTELIAELRKVSKSQPLIEFASPRLGEIPISIGDNSLIASKIDWAPKKSFTEIVRSEWIATRRHLEPH